MAKNDRQKRSARKARQAERAEHEAAVIENAVAKGQDPEKVAAERAAAAAKKSDDSDKNPGLFKRIGNWFHDVITEMKRVVWPTPKELRNYSFAVIGLLLFFGIVVWLVDTGIVAGLVQFNRLRPGSETAAVQTISEEELAQMQEGSSSEAVEASSEAPAEGEAADAATTEEAPAADATAEAAPAEEATAEAAPEATVEAAPAEGEQPVEGEATEVQQ